jgi:hypothetical protein
MTRDTLDLLDVHERTVPATPARTWLGLVRFVRRELLSQPNAALGALLGISAGTGWTVSREDPADRSLRVEGRHRFAVYAIDFVVLPAGADATVRATSFAEFLGPAGRAYRHLVVSTRLHVLATNWLLRGVAAATDALGDGPMISGRDSDAPDHRASE